MSDIWRERLAEARKKRERERENERERKKERKRKRERESECERQPNGVLRAAFRAFLLLLASSLPGCCVSDRPTDGQTDRQQPPDWLAQSNWSRKFRRFLQKQGYPSKPVAAGAAVSAEEVR
jgi:hypothetical protein